MKSYKIIAGAFVLLVFLPSCEHQVAMNTVVHEDGSLDKTIVLEGDSAHADNNFMGIGKASGWEVLAIKKDKVEKTDEGMFIISYRKHFESSEDANQELTGSKDSLFQVTSRFSRKFRWFYTYIRYSDSYQAINRLQHPTTDYFNQEDYAFIDRLPAEGSSISKADSLYLDRLNDKIFEVYGTRALFEEYYLQLEQLLKSENQAAWVDTLRNHKEKLFESMQNEKDIENFSDILRKGGITNLPVSDQKIYQLEQEIESLTNFFSKASSGKYKHSITMPYQVVDSNADSVAGNTLYWRPSSTKFLLTDYEMYGEARKVNSWPVAISVGFILLSIWLLFRKRKA
jgi:hypothetical protein